MSKITINAIHSPNYQKIINGKLVYVMSILAGNIVIAEEYFDSYQMLLASENDMKYKHAKAVHEYLKEKSQLDNKEHS